MARYIQKISFGHAEREWWVGWEIAGPPQNIRGLIPADSLTPVELQSKGVVSFQPVNAALLAKIERRATHRMRLEHPFQGRAGLVDVQVVDISSGGLGIAHESPLKPGKLVRVEFMAGERYYSMTYDLLRCQLMRGYASHGAPRYYSALRLHTDTPEQRRVLSGIIEEIVTGESIRDNPTLALALE